MLKSKTFKFSVVMFVVFWSHSLLYTQFVPYLTHVGYSASERGFLLAYFAVVGMLGQILTGYLSDRYGTVKKFFIFFTLILAASGYLFYHFEAKNFWVHLVLLGFTGGLIRVLGSFFETWVLEVDGLFDKFGLIRALGSLGWALGSLLTGYLIVNYSYDIVGIVAAIFSVILVFLSLFLEDATKVESQNLKLSDIGELFSNRNYVILIVVYFITYLVYNADSITVTELILELGGDAQSIGMKWFIQALIELPILFLGGKLLLKYKGRNLMLFASIVMLIRFMLYGFVTEVYHVYLITLLQCITFPLILITQKDLVYREVPPRLRSSGQMVAVSMTIGLSAIVTPILSGYLMEVMSVKSTIMVFGATMIIPIILMKRYQTQK